MSGYASTVTKQPVIQGPASGHMLRPFALPGDDGQTIRSAGYRQRVNVALVLFHDGCDACRTLLVRLAKDNASFREKNAVALAVGADGSAAAERLALELDHAFPILVDAEGRVAAAQGLTVPAVVVTDRFGEIWAAWEGGPDHLLPDLSEIMDWLDFIEIQCPECHPPEPWGDDL
jgi:peroxiredoxin